MEKVEKMITEPVYERIQVGTKTIPEIKYVAFDGKEFFFETQCKDYEKQKAAEAAEILALSKIADRKNSWLLFNTAEDFATYYSWRHPYNRRPTEAEFLTEIHGIKSYPQWIREDYQSDEENNYCDDYYYTSFDEYTERYNEVKAVLFGEE